MHLPSAPAEVRDNVQWGLLLLDYASIVVVYELIYTVAYPCDVSSAVYLP